MTNGQAIGASDAHVDFDSLDPASPCRPLRYVTGRSPDCLLAPSAMARGICLPRATPDCSQAGPLQN